ncbi:MAG: NAD kinase [Solobacterium sp.]|nr:NAD kinase [Solobacterium sp.]
MFTYAVVARPDEVSNALKQQTDDILTQHGYTLDETAPDTVLVIGGDGTFIYAVHKYIDVLDRVRFFGIHTGTLGFYTDYRDTDFEEFIQTFLNGGVSEYSYPILEAKTERGTYYGINEIRVENASRTQDMDVYLNGRLFETFRGTGLCVSTQLGSTAYNRSAGGAVIQEGLSLIELTEIAGIHHSKYRSLNSPFILDDKTEISFSSASLKGALLGADSEVFSLDDVTKIDVSVSKEKQVKMLKGRNVYYFDRLHSLF